MTEAIHTTTTRRPRRLAAAAIAAATVAGTFALAVPAADAATGHTAYFTIAGSDGHERVLVHGAINGGGREVSPDNKQYDVAHLGGGTLRLNHPDKKSHFTIVTANKRTCYFKFHITGKYTLNHGTGRYAGVTGKGTYKVTGRAILRRTASGACDMNGEPRTTSIVVYAHGPVKLP